MFGGITTQARKLGVFPQLRPPHPVMKGPWDSIFSAYQMCFKNCCPHSKPLHLPLTTAFELPPASNFPKRSHPQSSQRRSVFKTSLLSMVTLSTPMDLQAKRVSEQVPGTPVCSPLGLPVYLQHSVDIPCVDGVVITSSRLSCDFPTWAYCSFFRLILSIHGLVVKVPFSCSA